LKKGGIKPLYSYTNLINISQIKYRPIYLQHGVGVYLQHTVYKYEEEIIMKILFNVDVRNNVTYVSFKDCTIQTQNTVK
jgi:hypothetical protein